MANPKKLTRVVTCQGGIQLVAALAALGSREGALSDSDDYLVIHDLYAPNAQLQQFAAAVTKMAQALRDWKGIVYISREQMEELDRSLNSNTKPDVFDRVREIIGTPHADEIYLCRNWQFGNRLFINVYVDALKVCYGDSIGIYFSEAYFSPVVTPEARPFATRARLQLAQIKWSFLGKLGKKPCRAGYDALDEIDFDIGCFLLPEILGEKPPMKTYLVDKSTTANIFRKLAGAWDPQQIAGRYGYLAKLPSVILMTSNFSEAERMPYELELAAYREFLEGLRLPRESTLVIKPHPRDSGEKIQELGRRLGDLFSNVVLLTDPNLFFTPFEVFLMQAFLDENEQKPRDLKIITFSTACLSLPVLFNVEPIIGFGRDLVRRSFFDHYISGRLKHEHDLELAMQTMRR